MTRFSGRPAPKHRGEVPNCADWVMELAYSHEVSSCGFWPGGSPEGSFYAYAYPEPNGFADWKVEPAAAYYELEHDEDIRCGVLFGHGDHFTGGLDLAEVGPLVREGRLDELFSVSGSAPAVGLVDLKSSYELYGQRIVPRSLGLAEAASRDPRD